MNLRTVFANDILKDARNAWVNYFSKLGHSSENFHSNSIVDLVKLHKSGIDVFPENVDIVTGGFPCQDFSLSGKRLGLKSHKDHLGEAINKDNATIETRGQLYMWMKEVIEITKPKIFIAENVLLTRAIIFFIDLKKSTLKKSELGVSELDMVHLEEPKKTQDLFQRFFSKAIFIGVALRVVFSDTRPRSFLGVGFPLLSLTQLSPNQLN